jgi:DNA-binding CsgD family transcriptional regulator
VGAARAPTASPPGWDAKSDSPLGVSIARPTSRWSQPTNLWRDRTSPRQMSERLRGGTRTRCRLKPSRALVMNETIDLLQCHFSLTPAEARLALHLAAGETLRSASVKLSIRYETARTSLKNIFRKTGTCRQAELVIVILTAPRRLSLNEQIFGVNEQIPGRSESD